jgi:DNA helicase-2/ATP-dependent DNA helicase PcrA
MELFLQKITTTDVNPEESDPFVHPFHPVLDKKSSSGQELPNSLPAEQVRQEILGKLNPEQAAAVEQSAGPLLILAGAGSGKTRVIIHRIAWLLQVENVAPWQILAVTFTNKAAREMRERLYNLIGPRSEKVVLSTFHSLGLRLLRYESRHLDVSGSFTVYDSSDQESLLKKCLKELKIDPKQNKPSFFAHEINNAKDKLLDPDGYAEYLEQHAMGSSDKNELIISVYRLYEQRKASHNAFDFADLLYRTVRLLSENEEVLKKYRSRWKYLMVDEYQDTNHVQYRLCRLLSGEHQNIAVVGDDDQSIYSWRGAEIRNILDFEKDYPDCRQIKLEQNYRSTATILGAANSVIRNNSERKTKALWTDQGDGDPVILSTVHDESEEARQVLEKVQKHLRDGIPLQEMTILYRTNSQSRAFEEVLRRSGIAYRIIGGQRFYDRKEIKDALAYLTLLVNPHADVALGRILNFPPRGIGQTSLDRLTAFSILEGVSLYDALDRNDEIPRTPGPKLNSFLNMVRNWQAALGSIDLGELAEKVFQDSGLYDYYRQDNTIESENRLANLDELKSSMARFQEERPESGLHEFLQDISLYTSEEGPEEEIPRDCLTLMTLHNAKGLEFDVVFMVGMEEDVFPHYLSGSEISGMEEERRLCYVGMTRARKQLYLFTANARWLHGQKRAMGSSRFLHEIEPEFLRSASSRPYATQAPYSPFARPQKKKPSFEQVDAWAEGSQETEWDETQPSGERKLTEGCRVLHSAFGRGKVLSLSGKDDRQKAVVQFDNGQIKQLALAYAHLKLLDEL